MFWLLNDGVAIKRDNVCSINPPTISEDSYIKTVDGAFHSITCEEYELIINSILKENKRGGGR